jgi:hypothetical protein
MPWLPEVGEQFLAPNPITGTLELVTCSRRTNPQSPRIWAGERSFPLEQCHKLTFDVAMILYEQALENAALMGELLDKLQSDNY